MVTIGMLVARPMQTDDESVKYCIGVVTEIIELGGKTSNPDKKNYYTIEWASEKDGVSTYVGTHSVLMYKSIYDRIMKDES